MRSDRERLLDMLEAIERIEARLPISRETFDQDELLQIWFVHHLQILGEAAFKTSAELQSQHPEVAWNSMIGMRHILVHNYFAIDHDIVWNVLENEIQRLKPQIKQILSSM